jgi:uncharacterized membrane protein
MPAAASVLEYSAGTAGLPRKRRRWVWAVLSLPLLVVPFVPFACNATPMAAVVEGAKHGPAIDRESFLLMLIAMPLVLGTLLGIWEARTLWRTSSGERIVAHVVGLMMVGCAILCMGNMVTGANGLELKEWLTLGGTFVVLLGSAVVWARVWRRRRLENRDDPALASLLGGYLPAATLALLMFWDDREIGWYLTLYCAIVAGVQLVLLAVAAAAREKPA